MADSGTAASASSDANVGATNQRKHEIQRKQRKDERRHLSIFEAPPDFFDSCRLVQSPFSAGPIEQHLGNLSLETEEANQQDGEMITENEVVESNEKANLDDISSKSNTMKRLSCNTCKSEFESLQDQRAHFKSDIHRLNIKLSIAGKEAIKEEDFDEIISENMCRDNDISSISGSEDEDDKESRIYGDLHCGLSRSFRNKIFIQLQTGEIVSIWKCLLLHESEHFPYESKSTVSNDGRHIPNLMEREVMEKLKHLIHEPRDNSNLRIVLLARGGHFAGCVFDGNNILAHKTFHRYVIRAKAGKKQSSKDGSGKTVHSAGASLRRYNELALKKDVQELLAAWKIYFASSSSIFVYAPSNNRQLFFDGEKPYFICHHHAIRSVPLTVRRPTFKEAQRIYSLLTQISPKVEEEVTPSTREFENRDSYEPNKEELRENMGTGQSANAYTDVKTVCSSSEGESENLLVGATTPLHEASSSGNAQGVLELLEDGADPCAKDERGRTPYMLANEKEVRNVFRRFMALNLDKWDWHAAKVPSALTKEMEESQAAKQAEKDVKKKARAKELKKLRKARQKKAQADAATAQSQSASALSEDRAATSVRDLTGSSQFNPSTRVSKEEEIKRSQDAEREKRAAAAERRIAAAAALKASGSQSVAPLGSSQPEITSATDIKCSCCNVPLAGKVPFHRYNYKYCSTSCMYVHKEMLEDG